MYHQRCVDEYRSLEVWTALKRFISCTFVEYNNNELGKEREIKLQNPFRKRFTFVYTRHVYKNTVRLLNRKTAKGTTCIIYIYSTGVFNDFRYLAIFSASTIHRVYRGKLYTHAVKSNRVRVLIKNEQLVEGMAKTNHSRTKQTFLATKPVQWWFRSTQTFDGWVYSFGYDNAGPSHGVWAYYMQCVV